MPHLVTNFLRTSSGNVTHIHKRKKKQQQQPPAAAAASASSPSSTRTSSAAASPYASDSDDPHAVTLPDHHHHHHHHHHLGLADALSMKKHHRLSLPFVRSSSSRDHGGSSSSSASGSASNAAVNLGWSIESPPIVFHGSPEESSGALVSGQMIMDVKEETVEVDSFTASLRIHATHKRPFQGHCSDCQNQTTELKSWRLLSNPAGTTTLRRGRHLFPFSTLLQGHLPASMDTPIMSIAYEFRAEALVVRARSSCMSARFERSLDVKRSLPEPLYPHHSVRVFPPTNIKASAHYSSVIHPTATNQLTLKLDGLMTHNDKVKTVDLWRLKKVTWRLEEHIKTVAPACPKHLPAAAAAAAAAAADADDEDADADDIAKRGVLRTEKRLLGEKQLHEGWKSDFTGNDGIVDMEFGFCVNQFRPHSRDPKHACDLKAQDGTEVTHSLLIELIVSKEYAPEGKAHLATQTGTGRILRMHFAVVMTEFPGLGVSWDNESPPVYQDVPPSPPGYPVDEARGPPIEYEELEALDARRASVEPPEDDDGAASVPRRSD